MHPNGTVLVVEDEPLIAMEIEDAIKEMGLVSRTASGLSEAVHLALFDDLRAAVLDVQLRGDSSEPLAAILRARSIPFVISTGSEQARLPEAFEGVPILTKPYPEAELKKMLRHMVSGAATNVP